MAALPLSGVRVLDLSRHLPGPYVTAALADLGATVVKIEERDFGDPTRAMAPAVTDGTDSALHAWLNRGKKSVALDLKSEEGVAIVKAMAAKSDVLVESFRPGVMKRLGLDYPRLKRIAPKLLYVSLSGYGATGPRSRRATHDLNVAGEVGLLAGGATISPGLVADTAAGLLTLVAILAKLKDLGRPTFSGRSHRPLHSGRRPRPHVGASGALSRRPRSRARRVVGNSRLLPRLRVRGRPAHRHGRARTPVLEGGVRGSDDRRVRCANVHHHEPRHPYVHRLHGLRQIRHVHISCYCSCLQRILQSLRLRIVFSSSPISLIRNRYPVNHVLIHGYHVSSFFISRLLILMSPLSASLSFSFF